MDDRPPRDDDAEPGTGTETEPETEAETEPHAEGPAEPTPDSSERASEDVPSDARGATETPDRLRRDGPSDESVGALVQQPIVKSWTTYLTLLFGLAGAGFGLFGILVDAFDEPIVDGGPAGFGAAFSIPLTVTPYLGILLAVVVGAGLGWGLSRDRSTTYTVAGVGAGVATAAFWLVAALFGSVPLEASLEVGGLLVNAIVAGFTAGVVAVGGVWVTRTRAPVGLLESRGERR
ncbi:hypothetical protein [Natronolimnohabitans innermongolicus]|uniref:Uncharacterized protein n=1 Tax=Natronolimnohabitans innermongolicus JCM 12255 TaxID=1227499 RepID=L9X4L9_9EURY|nr:hypothetical protein [Natronolimnohabitans innermongolicus]ELY55513.1 hypothetical protein C493_11137 [Natronolimnohabitans innermongolicus JCM 12255]